MRRTGELLQDVRFTIRMWRRTPVATLLLVATLAIGLGATTAIYSAMEAALLGAMPWRDPSTLVQVFQRYRRRPNMDRMPVSPANYLDWQQAAGSFAGRMAAYRQVSLNLAAAGEAERVRGVESSTALFEVLGATAALGRTFTDDDAAPSAHSVAVISDPLWHRVFGRDPDVVGRDISLNGQPTTVVGVMPPRFRFPLGWIASDVEVWLPMRLTPAERVDRRATTLEVIARLRDDVTREVAQDEMDFIAGRLEQAHPDTNTGWATTVFPITERVASGLGRVLWYFAAAVLALLVIACANVANLLLTRGLDRRSEFAMRAALGADRRRLRRQVITEGLVLAAVGCAAALVLSLGIVAAVHAAGPTGALRDLATMRVDPSVVRFAAGLSLLAGIAFSLLPALDHARGAPGAAIGDAARATDSRARARLKEAVAGVQLALATALLVCASAILQGFHATTTTDPGFDPTNALTVRVTLPEERYPAPEQWTRLFDDLARRARGIPGVVATGVGTSTPMDGGGGVFRWRLAGQEDLDPSARPRLTELQRVGPGFFTATGIRVLRGRDFTPADRADAARVAIANEAFVSRALGDAAVEIVGATVFLDGDVNRSASPAASSPPITIVGVVNDTRHYGLQRLLPPILYLPAAQDPTRSMALIVRFAEDGGDVLPAIRAQLAAVDPQLPMYGVRTLEQVIRDSHVLLSLNALVFAVFGGAAWALAIVGVTGVFASLVARRRREFALRMALGARQSDVLRAVLRRALAVIAIGVAGGLALAWYAARVLGAALAAPLGTNLATSVAPHAALVAAVMVAAALTACLVPAIGAARADPRTCLT